MKNISRATLWAVGLISCGTILFEVCLTRIFSVTMWYYFGFFSISLAMLGIATAAVWCSGFFRDCSEEEYKKFFSISSFFFALSAPLSIFVHLNCNFGRFLVTDIQFYLILSIHILLLILAFFFSSLCISLVLFCYHREIGKVYSVDLIGAACGSFIVIPLMYYFSPLALIFLISAMAFLGCFLFNLHSANMRLQKVLGILFLSALIFFGINDRWGILKISHVKCYFHRAVQKEEPKHIFEKWSPMSRLVVFPDHQYKTAKNIRFMLVTNDGDAPTYLYRVDQKSQTMTQFKNWSHISRVVQQLKSNADVLVLGAGGGKEVVDSLAYNQRSITAVEVNPVLGDMVKKYFADYIGHIFDDPRVTLNIQDGRSFIAGVNNRYDIIQISMVDTWSGVAAGGYVFSENSLYTKEAITDYLSHLKPNGILSITRFYTFDEALRLCNTIVSILEQEGIKDIENRIVVLYYAHPNRALLLIKNGSFTAQEIEFLRSQSENDLYQFVSAPYLDQRDLLSSRYASHFRFLINTKKYPKSVRESFVKSYRRNITPSSDDKPFFFFMTHFKDSFHIMWKEHTARRLAIPILYVTFLMVNLFSFLLIILPLIWKNIHRGGEDHCPKGILGYFAGIGVGYMLIEVSLIQRLSVFLGHPLYAFVFVLSGLLVSSGLGSLMSQQLKIRRNILQRVLGAVIILGFLIGLLVYNQFVGWMGLSKFSRMLIAAGTIMPIGFLMGMCLPLGMRIISRFGERLIPWAWGINGAFSVLGSTLSLILALNWGLRATFLTGVMCYLLAAVLIVSFKDDLCDLKILK